MNDNTRAVSVARNEVLQALLEQAAQLSRLWLGQEAPKPHLEAAALLAERLMILLGEIAEDWWHSQMPMATSRPGLAGEGRRMIPVLTLQAAGRSVTLDLARLVKELAASTGYPFDETLMALTALCGTHTTEELGKFASYAAVKLVHRWKPEVEAWLAAEQTTYLPLPPVRSLH